MERPPGRALLLQLRSFETKLDTIKILILEEETVVAEDIRDCLQDAGYEVERASSLRDALKKLSEFKPNLILIGVVSKDGQNELKAATQLSAANSNHLKFIFMVSKPIYIDGEIEDYQLLQKPFGGEQLLQLIEQ
jgi:DNA-binding response OmpR family regulator